MMCLNIYLRTAILLQGLPVNVKFVIEGMEEVGSQGLEKLVEDKKNTFFSDVDYIVVTDTPWLSKKPGITYGARGNCYFFLEVWYLRFTLEP